MNDITPIIGGWGIKPCSHGWMCGKIRTRDRDGEEVEYLADPTYHGTVAKACEAARKNVEKEKGIRVPPSTLARLRATSEAVGEPLDLFTGEQAKGAALDALERSHMWWITLATAEIRRLARRRDVLTSDDIWAVLRDAPPEPRAMGAAFRRAAREGVIRKTDHTIKSIRPECHGRDVRVWRSLIQEQVA